MTMSDHMRWLRSRVGNALLEVPAAGVVVRDGDRVLLARHLEGDVWVLPGGAIEPEETPADAALRELWEETGLVARLEAILGVYGGPDCTVRYGNGDRTSYLMVIFEGRASSGEPRPDGVEITELRFVTADEAWQLPLAPWLPDVLRDVFSESRRTTFRPATWKPPDAR